jgi:toxin FitB
VWLLDTNILSELRKGSRCHPNVARWSATVTREATYTSVLVIGEIRRGVESVRRRDARQAAVFETWLEQVRHTFAGRILGIDERVAEQWGRFNVPDPIPVIDGLLAATAKIQGMILVTRNVADLERTGVKILNPFADRA